MVCRGEGWWVPPGAGAPLVCECMRTCATCGGSGVVAGVPEVRGGVSCEVLKACECVGRRARVRAWCEAGVRARYLGATLGGMEGKPPVRDVLISWLRGYETSGAQSRWLVLSGGVGTGKTHAVSGALRALTLRGMASVVTYEDMETLMARLRGSGSGVERGGVLGPVVAAGVAVVDEVGVGRWGAEWERDTLEFVVSVRYNSGLPTLLCTNIRSVGEFRRVVGERVASRLVEVGEWVDCGDVDFRRRRVGSWR